MCMHAWQGGSSEWDRCELKQRGWPSQSAGWEPNILAAPTPAVSSATRATVRRDSRAVGSTQIPPSILNLQPLEV